LGNYRGRLDIIADILNVVKRKAKKTQIMYQANLSFKVLQRYLAEIMGASLVNFDDGANCYVLTEKGFKFLSAYQKYSKTNKHIENRINEARSKKDFLEKLCSEQA
jgi:predicted transcriptional regulator